MPRYAYQRDAQGNPFPIIPLSIAAGERSADTGALLDSGANISVFCTDIADLLGVRIESGELVVLGGVGGRIVGYIHQVELTVAGLTFPCHVVLSRQLNISFNLLGRQDCFQHFIIRIDEARQVVTLTPHQQGA